MVKGRNTKPEIIVRKFLFEKGFRYRLNVNNLPGKPDIVLAKHKVVIMINGCFWHGHEGCSQFRMPKTSLSYWNNKIQRNIQRDAKNITDLNELGWKVIIIWECDLKKDRKEDTLLKLVQKIRRN
jgi:DNA mismatch endonuclease (patch repair protein)